MSGWPWQTCRRMSDHYKALGVDPSAPDEVIRAAFKALAMKFHPDRNRGQTQVSTEHFKTVEQAYWVLSDPGRRAEYDAARARERAGSNDSAQTRRRSARPWAPPPNRKQSRWLRRTRVPRPLDGKWNEDPEGERRRLGVTQEEYQALCEEGEAELDEIGLDRSGSFSFDSESGFGYFDRRGGRPPKQGSRIRRWSGELSDMWMCIEESSGELPLEDDRFGENRDYDKAKNKYSCLFVFLMRLPSGEWFSRSNAIQEWQRLDEYVEPRLELALRVYLGDLPESAGLRQCRECAAAQSLSAAFCSKCGAELAPANECPICKSLKEPIDRLCARCLEEEAAREDEWIRRT
jgi:curved DNA-binding protein CbpA